MAKRKHIRWAVEAIFPDGTRVIIRDFATFDLARRWLEKNGGRDLYPGRVYRLDIKDFEVTDDDVSH